MGPRHGRHRRGSVNSAWTPAVRPTEAGRLPAHARFAWAPPPRADDLTAEDTSPIALVPRQREPEAAIVHEVPETPPRGLRKFDLGIVPASVTPPRSWRKAAWFAVGTSAAVVCGLAVAAVRFVGQPPSSNTIDALPAFPTQELGALPVDETTAASRTSTTSSSSRSSSARPDTASRTQDGQSSSRPHSSASGSSSGTTMSDPTSSTWTTLTPPQRTTVGRAPVTPTDPEAMGDRTEQYFALVTEDPQAAHELCTGGMAREGPEGIEARYGGVDHVEVQQITIDRNTAETTSTVKIVREDGTETVEQRQLTFTWGGDPKISDDTPTA
ncbi:hypothetical protein [Actinophytocola sp.]|uniref:hypothetical protein n=1 Tax=Actinophytocola sp. TaxID=1872138 RepID=UPI003D6AB815